MSLWITYAWKDNEEGNFDYLVQQLENAGIHTQYDKVAIVPGQRLWTQIADKINAGDTRGWAYLVTPGSLASQPCLEELAYALDRTLNTKDGAFPVIGLVTSRVNFKDVPAVLKVRLCISLKNPNWIEQVKAGLELRAPKQYGTNQSRFIYHLTQQYNGTGVTTVIEIRPRFEEVHFWRFAVPESSNVVRFGVGPVNGGNIGGVMNNMVEGTLDKVKSVKCKFGGSGNILTPGTSAYVYIDNGVPDFLAFGHANGAFELPVTLETQKLK